MGDEYIRPIKSTELVWCDGCGEVFLKSSIQGRYVRCFGICERCMDYFEGFQKFLEEQYSRMEEDDDYLTFKITVDEED